MILEVDGLVANHGLLTAVRGVSLSIEQGEVLAVVGANGAGKTTLFRCLAGVHAPASGSIRMEGRDVTSLKAHQRVKAGIAMVPEGRRLFDTMTVAENLRIAGENGRRGTWTQETVLDALPQLKLLLKRQAGNLSGGQRQAVAIGRALMSNPKLLLLDEVSLGLSPIAIEGLYESLEALKQTRATTLVVVEQELDRAIAYSDRLVCMLEGSISLAGVSSTIDRQEITNAYFGVEALPVAEARGAA